MEPELCTIKDVEALVAEIVTKHNLKDVLNIKYSTGTDVAHGFLSKTVAVDIITQNQEETIHLWMKFVSDHNHFSKLPMEKLYHNEIYFYTTIYPAYTKFFDEKGVKDGFQNTAKCYGALPKGMLALENLKSKGFQSFDKNEEATIDKHIENVLKAYAKFHAVSFAFKDQKKDEWEKFRQIVFDFYEDGTKKAGIVGSVRYTLEEFFRQLNPVEDRKIFYRFDVDTLIKHITDPQIYVTENAILTQGDCWFNNAMFLYEEGTKNILDVKLIDWQMIRFASPIYDLAYYFYPIATSEILENFHKYFDIYYDELSRQIRNLGSDPDVVYSRQTFMKEWREHSKYGFTMASIVMKLKLSGIRSTWDRQQEFSKRMKALAEHFIDNNFV